MIAFKAMLLTRQTPIGTQAEAAAQVGDHAPDFPSEAASDHEQHAHEMDIMSIMTANTRIMTNMLRFRPSQRLSRPH